MAMPAHGPCAPGLHVGSLLVLSEQRRARKAAEEDALRLYNRIRQLEQVGCI